MVESDALITANKAGWIGFFLYVILPGEPATKVGTTIGGGIVAYLFFYLMAKIIGKIRG